MNIKYILIHCSQHTEREKHIKKIFKTLKQPIDVFNGIYVKNISLDEQEECITTFDNNIRFDERRNYRFSLSGQIGCYLSHFKVIEEIMTNKKNNLLDSDYSVIFEDDVKFNKYLHQDINQIICDLNTNNFDFDIIYLGNFNNNHANILTNNIYHLNKNTACWGTHALLINNKNIDKIYNVNCRIKGEIDNHYYLSIINNELNGLVIYPPICFQYRKLKSNIS
jgi:GR25 family glycosyltransferase involved in LPS biosynthesis